MSAPCVFCEIVAGRAPATVVSSTPQSLVIAPLNPVTPGHLLVIPREHVADAFEDRHVSAETMRDAVSFVNRTAYAHPEYESANIITSIGAAATQTVFHLHVHIVPRREGDGLHLPWTESD